MERIIPMAVAALVALFLVSCATAIDWNSRIGVYTYNQAIIDYGAPMTMTRLKDGSVIADWMTKRGTVVVQPAPYFYGPGPYYRGAYYGYGPTATGSTSYFPAQFIRLEFDANERLKAWKKYSK